MNRLHKFLLILSILSIIGGLVILSITVVKINDKINDCVESKTAVACAPCPPCIIP